MYSLKLDIFRNALLQIGANDIASESDNSLEAKTCNLLWNTVKKSILRDFDFSFARKSATLAQLDETHPDWRYCYRYPSDCVAIRRIIDGFNGVSGIYVGGTSRLGEVRQSLDGDKLVWLCDVSPCNVIYTTDKTNESMFDALAVDAATMNLAMRLCTPLKRDLDTLKVVKALYDEMIDASVFASANEGGEEYSRASKYR